MQLVSFVFSPDKPKTPHAVALALCPCRAECKSGRIRRVKYWEIIADNLSKAGWSLGWLSAVDSNGRTIFVADAHCGDGKRYVVRADEKLTAFVELESPIRGCADCA
jgi:hypothetical protein